MKVLIVGGGGREHALAWKVALSPAVQNVYVAPGNAGTAVESNVRNVAIGADDIDALATFAAEEHIDLTIVGPEAPLVAGIVDVFQREDLKIFGPTQEAAQLEGSKAFTKDFLARYDIPTAAYAKFTTSDAAIEYIRKQGAPIVVKADGLAAGKGVILAQDEDQAIAAVRDMLEGGRFGEAGERIVIEELLRGEEASFICMVDGEHILPMASSQDHKARDDGDQGPNTGGMGAYSPAPVVTSQMHARIMQQVIEPTVSGMSAEGIPYCGFLYAGLMITADGIPKVLEYNCRFGDPEAQPILMRLQTDLVTLCLAGLDKNLDAIDAQWDPRCALGVVLSAGGYPSSYRKGDVITGLPKQADHDTKVFHAGTAQNNDNVITNGGRVLCAVALGDHVSEAQRKAYQLAEQIFWDGMYYRRDIGYRAVAREKRRRNS